MGHNWSESVRSKWTRHCAVKELKSEWLHFSQPHSLLAEMWLSASLCRDCISLKASIHLSWLFLNYLLLMLDKKIYATFVTYVQSKNDRLEPPCFSCWLPCCGPAVWNPSFLEEENLCCLKYRTTWLAFLCVMADYSLVNSKPNEWDIRVENAAGSLELLNMNLGEKLVPKVTLKKSMFLLNWMYLTWCQLTRTYRRLWNGSPLCFKFFSF